MGKTTTMREMFYLSYIGVLLRGFVWNERKIGNVGLCLYMCCEGCC